MASKGYAVIEVNRPDRSVRYRKGKNDPTDAEMSARAVLAGVADTPPKSGEGEVEMIPLHKSARDSTVKARTPVRKPDESTGRRSPFHQRTDPAVAETSAPLVWVIQGSRLVHTSLTCPLLPTTQ